MRKGTGRMVIIDYEKTENPGYWLDLLNRCDWSAGRFLHRILEENRFHELYGEKARVLMLTDGADLVSFCTYAEKDDIPDTALTPWLGFVYTAPEYRGRRMMGRLIAEVKALARDDGYDTLWISTHDSGIYETYGAAFDRVLKDNGGQDSRIYRLNTYGFRGWEKADVPARNPDYPGIGTPRDLYNALWRLWKRETCAPRMRQDWSEENPTLGQCSVTAFLAQDLFGGRVYGVLLEDGSFHCFNVVGETWFDLTSEQFGGRELQYGLDWEQSREEHFRKAEKRERYEMLKAALAEYVRAAE